MGSLLGAIIGKFTNQFENVATEGLAHIIGSSEVVRKQLVTFLNTKLVFPITIPFGQDKETCLLNIQMQLDFICACLPEKN